MPERLSDFDLALADGGHTLVYSYDTSAERTGIARLMAEMGAAGLVLRDLRTSQNSLEDIFVGLVHEGEDRP